MSNRPLLLWLRRCLRLSDNPVLAWACAQAGPGGAVIPVYIHSPGEGGDWPIGAASRWWLHHSLASLDASLRQKQSRLIVRTGSCLEVLHGLIEETGANTVCWDRCYEQTRVARDQAIKSDLKGAGLTVKSFNTSLIYEPWDVQTKNGGPYKVFTPFWRACSQLPAPSRPVKAPKQIPAPGTWPESCELEALNCLPAVDWAAGMRKAWQPGEAGAHTRLKSFLDHALYDYHDQRDRPDISGTSRLSPYLHFGEISPRRVWHAVNDRIRSKKSKTHQTNANEFLRQLGWREFAYHLIYHFPHTANEPLRPQFQRFPWDTNDAALKAWQRGRTGYPIVDAGMRELWHTGWMHNRVRMIVASFLVKDLLLNWRHGAEWFWDTLVDADLANNTLGWQWAGGCGADAAPYFRVFNPVLQGRKFDPEGRYVRRWVPELARLDTRWVHEPWNAKPKDLQAAGIELGRDYPRPIVDHSQARDRALEAFEKMKISK